MLKEIKTSELKLGMYVILPVSWMNHPFFKSQFVINSEEQIEQIVNFGIKKITIDTSKGKCDIEFVDTISHSDSDIAPPEKWEPEKLFPSELKDKIHDKDLTPKKKAEAVYGYSLDMMNKLLNDPTTENIKISKEYIYDIVDVILSEEETSDHLLNITSHDFYTYTHSVNVGILAIMLSKVLIKDYSDDQMRELGAGFFLHDLGKVKIDPAIINKPGRLTKEEMFQMRTHPFQGFKLLRDADQLSEECKVIVLQHHEREDGTGYPKGLKGDQIHLYGRIGFIADVFDALTAERSYKQKLSPFEALKLMKEEMLGFFHKEVFNEFVLLFK